MAVITRSQSKTQIRRTPVVCSMRKLENEMSQILIHEFDDSHNAWIENKRKNSRGQYEYICGKTILCKRTKQPKKCSRFCCDKLGIYNGCKTHFNWDSKMMLN